MAGRNRYEEPVRRTIDARAPMATPPQGFAGGPPRQSNGMTEPLAWANMFRRRDNQLQALPVSTTPATPAAQAPSITSQVLSEITSKVGNAPITWSLDGSRFVSPTAAPGALPSQLVGNRNQAQNWLQRAAEGRERVAAWQAPKTPLRTTYGGFGEPQREALSGASRFGWGTAFR